jgi:hypothetical protein
MAAVRTDAVIPLWAYVCVCVSWLMRTHRSCVITVSKPLTREAVSALEKLPPVVVQQQTPVRVAHRCRAALCCTTLRGGRARPSERSACAPTVQACADGAAPHGAFVPHRVHLPALVHPGHDHAGEDQAAPTRVRLPPAAAAAAAAADPMRSTARRPWWAARDAADCFAAQAGTYVKEFVHGDRGRSKPRCAHSRAVGDGIGGSPSLTHGARAVVWARFWAVWRTLSSWMLWR